jgi:hypothetical protein
MAERHQLEFFLLRYVPDAVKDEFVNIGLVMLQSGANGSGFVDVRFTRDWRRVRCLDPGADVEMLQALEREIRGQLKDVGNRERLLHKLEDSYSNLIQLSATKGCLAEDPAREIETLAKLYCEVPKGGVRHAASGRQQVLSTMRSAFEQAGVWELLMKGIAVAPYTKAGDPLKFDFGYRVGDSIKIFHAVSLKANVDQAIMLASRYPKIANGIARAENAQALLTAVVDDDLDRRQDEIRFALGALEESSVRVAVAREMPILAEKARVELMA